MIENLRYTEINLSGLIQEVVWAKNPFCVSSKKLFLKYNNKTADWVGHSKLKLLDTIYHFKRKKYP